MFCRFISILFKYVKCSFCRKEFYLILLIFRMLILKFKLIENYINDNIINYIKFLKLL